ncbi:MAG TPA: CPBP family intramembrane glutamic endopeptidase, partial [Chitinophagaceae bacterium]|nr:CPBP family intramembrane glutamic endopeptidase [Chitinophagaceae bacterium]
TSLSDSAKDIIVAGIEACIATAGYIFLFRAYDKRRIHELSIAKLGNDAIKGLLTGIILQSLFILIIYLAGTFWVVNVNPVSVLLRPFAFALTAGFVAEIILIGIVFRLLEEQTGTAVALIIFTILFAVLHVNAKGATFVSVGATAMQAGFMLPAAYVFSRSLWLPIFLHLGWDFAEPGIFGAINSSTSVSQGLFTSKISGAALLTGAQNGPQGSLQAFILCLLTGTLFLLLAKQKNNLVKINWRTAAANKSIAANKASH